MTCTNFPQCLINSSSHSSCDVIHEGLSRGHLDPLLVAAPEDGSRDSIELRRPSRGHVFLHRTSQSVGSPIKCRKNRLGGELGPSAIATEQTSVIHASRRECHLASDRHGCCTKAPDALRGLLLYSAFDLQIAACFEWAIVDSNH